MRAHGWRTRRSVAALLAIAGLTAGCAGSVSDSKDQAISMPSMDHSMSGEMGSAGVQTRNQAPAPMHMVRHGHDVSIHMTTEETTISIAPGISYNAWTFDGTVPGPVIYLQQGDHVTLTLHNIDPDMPHSIYLHAATAAPAGTWTEVPPNGTGVVRFNADTPGVFLYHCGTEPMITHMAHGMYGAIIVTPPGTARPDYTMVQSEFYPAGNASVMLDGPPQYVVFNGQASRYADHPLHAKVGKPLTIAFVNAGPNEFSAFHIVGNLIHDAQASGNPNNHLYDIQTYTVAPGDGALFTVVFHKPGTYKFLSHVMSQMEKGAVGKITVSP